MIYCTAALAHRKATGKPLKRIELDEMHSVEIVGLLAPLAYMGFVYWKASLGVFDAAILIVIYAAYLYVLSQLPPERENQEDLESVPKAIVGMARIPRVISIAALFTAGGALIYFTAEPFLGSLLALSTAIGIPSFLFIQWVAPFVSEFPEMASTFYFARSVRGAPMALMNMVSSNINQWTLLAAMLPIVLSISSGAITEVPFDDRQSLELLMTIGQALVGALFLINMELTCREAAALFVLFIIQFVFSAVPPGPGAFGYIAEHIHHWTAVAYFAWAFVEVVRIAAGGRMPPAFVGFVHTWNAHVRGLAPRI